MAKTPKTQNQVQLTGFDLTLARAKIRIVSRYPFLSTILLNLKIQYSTAIFDHGGNQTVASTDGVSIKLDPELLTKRGWTSDQVMALLAHEVWHVALEHPFRIRNRDPHIWNLACDQVVHDMLIRSGIALPPEAFHDSDYDGLSAEQVYERLKANSPSAPPLDTLQTPEGDSSQRNLQQQLIRRLVSRAIMTEKLSGKTPNTLKRWFDEYTTPKVKWWELLRTYYNKELNELDRADWSRPSKRLVPYSIYWPHIKRKRTGKVAIIIDTSGSITNSELSQFAAEVSSILQDAHADAIVIYADAAVQVIEERKYTDFPIKLKPVGGGGTDFRPAFKYLDTHDVNVDAIIYLTDLECYDYPAQPPGIPVFWVTTANKDSNAVKRVPFGTILFLSDQG